MRYVMLTAENESKGLKTAKGSTSKMKRSTLLCNVNYGYHTDWARDFMRESDTTEEIVVPFAESFNKLSNVTGIGASRAVQILLWLSIAYDVEIDVPDEMPCELARPKCQTNGTDVPI
eukprot:7745475-Pyramimonas_sp.AAC.1